MNALLLVEHDGKTVSASSLKAIYAAHGLVESLDLLVTGCRCNLIAAQLASLGRADKIIVVNNEALAERCAMRVSAVVETVARDYEYLMGSASGFCNAVLARVAASLDVALISNVVSLLGKDTFVRAIYANRFHQTIKSYDEVKVLTLTSNVSSDTMAHQVDTTGDAAIQELLIDFKPDQHICKISSVKEVYSSRPELQSAGIVIGAGRGIETRENFNIVEALADHLGAALGATRAVVDLGWMTHHHQIGQTAARIAPEIYIALGVSGAVQHLAGVLEARTIIAVNKDPEAPMMKRADYVLVGDLNDFLPEIQQHLQTRNQSGEQYVSGSSRDFLSY